jgi:hypothetical protein
MFLKRREGGGRKALLFARRQVVGDLAAVLAGIAADAHRDVDQQCFLDLSHRLLQTRAVFNGSVSGAAGET